MNNLNNQNNMNNEVSNTPVNNEALQNQTVVPNGVTPPNNPVNTDQFGLPVVSPNNNDGGSDKKKFIIIGVIAVVLILVIVLVVMSNNASDTTSNNKEKNNSSSKLDNKADEVKENKLYFYKDDDRYAIFDDKIADNSVLSDYELIETYTCKNECSGDYFNNYEGTLLIYINDGGKVSSYDPKTKEYGDLTFASEIDGKNVSFKIIDDIIIAISDNNIKVSDDKIDATFYKDGTVQGKKIHYAESFSATLESLKENIYAIDEDYNEYHVYSVYQGTSKLTEIKESDLGYFQNIVLNSNFISIKQLYKDIVVSRNGKVQLIAEEDKYSLSDNNVLYSNDKGYVEVYSSEGKVKEYEATDSRIAGSTYAVIIKDNKLSIIDAITGELVYDFGQISENEKFITSNYSKSVKYSEGGYEIISIFLEDTTKNREDKYAIGKTYTYQFYNKEGRVSEDRQYIVD